MADLLSPATFGALSLRNRLVMAPMTRSRADADGGATELMVEYYRQRATAGLVVTEGIAPSEVGKGYCRTPVLDGPQSVAGWRAITDAVHAEGGTIVAQVMHCGRIAHADNKAPGADTVAPSAIRAAGQMYTDTAGMEPFEEPRELSSSEIPVVVDEYRRFASLAVDAGFDGVELHGTSGYLPAQFLSTGTNRRTDGYGGSTDARVRFPVEVLKAMAAEIGADRLGLRICPGNPFNDLEDADVEDTFRTFLTAIRSMRLAYLHVIRLHDGGLDNLALARGLHDGPLIVNDSYGLAEAGTAIADAACDAVSFARLYISNPDLVARVAGNLPLTAFDPRSLYLQGPAGYTDYPTAVNS
jgi:N-ethylmaleimide reductase